MPVADDSPAGLSRPHTPPHSPAAETLHTEMVRAFPVPPHTRTLVHRWRDWQRLPDVRVL